MGWWNSWKDTAQRLVVPFGIGADREKSPWWDLGGQATADGPGAAEDLERKRLLNEQAGKAGGFADEMQTGVSGLSKEASAERDYLRRIASGQESVSAEQLRQGLQQNMSAQRSMAAGASPQNSAMAARTAAMQSARLGSGLAGQQALAGLQERQNAHKGLSDMILGERGQNIQGTLGGRQTATQGYGAGQQGAPEKSWMEKYGPALGGVAGLFSDKRLKKDIEDGDDDADAAIRGLRALSYKYKSSAFGKGKQIGILAQDLERAGLKQAVIDTPAGKAVDVGKLTGANAAMIARLGARLAKLEGKGAK